MTLEITLAIISRPMARHLENPKARKRRPPNRADAAALFLRLKPQEKEVIARAASLRGWSATSLVRRAAIERAAQIINIETDTSLDLQGFAEQVANILRAERKYFHRNLDDDGLPFDQSWDPDPESGWPVSTPEPLTREDILKLDRSVLLGGTEFLRLVVERCRFLSRQKASQSPIDPSKIIDSGRNEGRG